MVIVIYYLAVWILNKLKSGYVVVHTSSKFGKSFRVKFLICFRMQKFAFLRTWPYSYMSLEYVFKNANFCIQRQIKNFTQDKLRKFLIFSLILLIFYIDFVDINDIQCK